MSPRAEARPRLVDDTVNAQQLIDVLAALDRAGVHTIGLGMSPGVVERTRRGKRIPWVKLGQPNAQGELDKAVIRRIIKSAVPTISTCYQQGLATNPALAGTVESRFYPRDTPYRRAPSRARGGDEVLGADDDTIDGGGDANYIEYGRDN